jgi:cytochrome c-type biogenesis protein CcmH
MKRFVAAACIAFASAAFGQADEIANPNPAVEARLKDLGEELRCLVCQNQTIADSNAPLALDLRNQIRSQIAAGKSDDEIRAYMVNRYGDFVLYKPPVKSTTLVLWVGPFVLIVVGAAIFAVVVRRRRAADTMEAAPGVAPQRRAEIEALLEEAPPAERGRKR